MPNSKSDAQTEKVDLQQIQMLLRMVAQLRITFLDERVIYVHPYWTSNQGIIQIQPENYYDIA